MHWGEQNGPPYPLSSKQLSSEEKKKAKRNVKDLSDDELGREVKRLNLENQYKKLSKESDKSNGSLERTKKVVDASSEAIRQTARLNKEAMNSKRRKEKLDLSDMTDQELRNRINRELLERQYNDLFAKESSTATKGEVYIQNALEAGGAVLAIGSSALGIALAIKELRR